MSITKASYSMVNGAPVNIIDFGAVSGASDCTSAIQAAVNSQTNGYTVYIPAGTWNFTEVTIQDKTNLTITGPGILNGQFTVYNVANDNDVQSNIVFQDLSFNCGRPDAGATAIKLVKVSALKITGCFFKGVQKCIVVAGLSGITQSVQRVSITNCSTGIADASLYSSSEKVSPYVYQTEGFPYYFYYNVSATGLYGAGDVTITGCNPCFVSVTHVYAVGQDGLVLTGNTFFHTSYSYQSPIKQNVVYGETIGFANITNNEMFEAGYEGIYFNGISNATVVGNNIIWPGQRDANHGYGISIQALTGDPVTASQITGNLIRIPTSNGINVGNNCRFVSCVGNKIITPGNNAFYYGTNPIQTSYGISTQNTGWQNAYYSNVTMGAYNLIVKSYDTTYGDYRLAGPFQNDNIVISGNGARADSTTVGTITSNTIDINGAQSVLINTLGGTINNITGGNSGYATTFYVASNAITLQASSSIILGTASTLTVPVGGNVTLLQKGSVWQLISSAL